MNTKLLTDALETLRNDFECRRLSYPHNEDARRNTARAINTLARALQAGHLIACPECGKPAMAASHSFYGYWFAVCETHGEFTED